MLLAAVSVDLPPWAAFVGSAAILAGVLLWLETRFVTRVEWRAFHEENRRRLRAIERATVGYTIEDQENGEKS